VVEQQRREPFDILRLDGLAGGVDLGQCRAQVAGVPKHHRIDHQTQRPELVILTFAVALPPFAPLAVEDRPRHGVPALTLVELGENAAAIRLKHVKRGDDRDTASPFLCWLDATGIGCGVLVSSNTAVTLPFFSSAESKGVLSMAAALTASTGRAGFTDPAWVHTQEAPSILSSIVQEIRSLSLNTKRKDPIARGLATVSRRQP
jgi:hypothetical protein